MQSLLNTSTNSGWNKSPASYYLFSDLAPNTTYTFTANSKNSLGLTNTPCSTVSTCTKANVLTGLTAEAYGNEPASEKGYIELAWGPNDNPPDTIYELY